jgi:hypothetical protein
MTGDRGTSLAKFAGACQSAERARAELRFL